MAEKESTLESGGPARPVVSVIVATYNYGRYLNECLGSVFTQTFHDIEVIVVDDGSIDDTPDILESISDARLRHFRIPNSGISGARNFGMQQASGKFIAFMDADDRWRPKKLECQLAVMRSEPSVGVVFCDFVRFNENGFLPNAFSFFPELSSVLARESADGRGKVIVGDAFREILRFALFPTYLQVTLFRRELLGDLEFPLRLRLSEDLYFLMRLFERTDVGYIAEPHAEVRRHESNVSKSSFEQRFWDLKALLLLEKDVAPRHRRDVRARIARVHTSIGYHFSREKRRTEAAKHYVKSLAYPGQRLNALLHLAALPVLTFVTRQHKMS